VNRADVSRRPPRAAPRPSRYIRGVLRIGTHPEPAFVPGSAPPPRGWRSLRTVRATLGAFFGDLRALPPIARRRWIATAAAGFCASVLVVLALTRWAEPRLSAGAPLAERDALLLRWMADHGPISFSNAILLESFGNLAYLVPVTLLCFAVAARRRRPLLALGFVATYVLQRPIVVLGWAMWDRPRPDLIAAGIAAPGLNSFPSGHAALTFSMYGLLTWLWIRATRSPTERATAAVLFALLIFVVGWSRVVLSSHWPSDILAGWVVGLCWVTTIVVAQRRAENAGGR
jgi:membrane-associated phospholipid phosphatase